MTLFWIVLLCVVGIVGFAAIAQNNAAENERRRREIDRINRENDKRHIEDEAQKIADGINTAQEAAAIERQRNSKENARDRASINGTAYARLDREFQILDKAHYKLRFKTFGWFMPLEDMIEIDAIPLEIVKCAGELLDNKTYQALTEKYPDFKDAFAPYVFDSDPQEFKTTKTDLALREKFIAFKQILESNEPKEDKKAALNKIVKSSTAMRNIGLDAETIDAFLAEGEAQAA